MNEDRSNSFLFVDSLWQHRIEVPVPHALFNREFIQKNGSIFHTDPHSGLLTQYELRGHKLIAIDSVQLVNGNIEQYHWKNNSDTLLLTNVVHGEEEICRFYEIDTRNLKLIRDEELAVPAAVGDFDILSIGLLRYEQEKLWIAYAYSQVVEPMSYTTLDTMYYTSFDFNSLQISSQQKDQRSTYPGGINTVQTYSATVENGDFYFMSCPGIAAGNSEMLPTAIFRKKYGKNKVDTGYMINVSEQINNHAYGFWYVGNGKAIIRAERQDKFDDFANHHAVYQFEYFLVDLIADTFEKLNLPLDKGTRKENVFLEENHVFFGIDDESGKHSVWKYDLHKQHTVQILSINESASYILRLEKVK